MAIDLPPKFQMFEAYLDFLEDGKLAPFARLAVKYPDSSELFIRAVENLDAGRSYPFAITRLPEKMRQRMDLGRPRTPLVISDGRIAFIKVASEKQRFLAKWNGEPKLPIKELIARVEAMDMPDSLRFDQMSKSAKYSLFKAAKSHKPADKRLMTFFEIFLFDEDERFMELLALNEPNWPKDSD